MDEHIKQLIEDILKIEEISEYRFREVCGFTFVFSEEIMLINDEIASAQLKPIAIIYEENGQYYLAPIDVVDEIEEVVKQFVYKQLR